MKRLILFVLLFPLAFAGCINDDTVADSNLLSGEWKVVSFEDITTGTVETKTTENSWNQEIVVSFDFTKDPKTINGTNISNQIAGELTFSGPDRFIVTNFISTYVNQPQWADEFTQAILDPNLTFAITGNDLVIYYQNKLKSVTLARN